LATGKRQKLSEGRETRISATVHVPDIDVHVKNPPFEKEAFHMAFLH
jgi:hypothetical protein